MDIKEALMNMDALDDDQWTQEGAPKIDVVSEMVGSKVTRQDIIDAAPEFTKDNMVVPDEDAGEDDEVTEEVTEEAAEPEMGAIEEYLEGDPLPEMDFIAFLNELDAATLNPLETVLVEQLAAIEATLSKAEDFKLRIKRSLAYTRNRIKAEIPDMDNQSAIQAFIKSQNEQRGIKAERTRELLQGVDLKSLDPRSAIDRAMARKNTRGGARPVRPNMK